jgi:putative transposase
MPNHFHLIALGGADGAISACMQRLTSRHSRQLRRDTASQGSGHVYQGRFWSDVIRSDRDFLQVQRYIEANPVRAKFVDRAELWRWSSLWERETGGRKLLDASPVALPAEWVSTVNCAR